MLLSRVLIVYKHVFFLFIIKMDFKRIHMDDVGPLFPVPIKLQEHIVWPLTECSHILISGYLDEEEKVIIIQDFGSIFTLMKLGFFGLYSNRELQFLYCRSPPDFSKISPFTLGTYVLKEIDIPNPKVKFDEDMNIEKTIVPIERTNVPNLVLKLSFEEAYFLSYGLGILRISKSENFYKLDELWSKFTEINSDFPFLYSAYHYFRSKGWIVRNGYKFGSNYLLYQEGPAFNHATYSVILNIKNQIQWQQLTGLIRVSKNAGKELLVCNVVVPENVPLTSPKYIKDFSIQLFHISRNVPTEVYDCSTKSQNEEFINTPSVKTSD